jgi:hypothetical protein
MSASSALAVPVPRSLCGCTEITTSGRPAKRRTIHSIWSANTLGVAHSTVVGRFRMMGRPGPQAAMAVSQACNDTSSSARLKVSGEYCSTHSVPGCASVSCRTCRTRASTSSITWGTLMPNTTSRHTGATAL